jgi:hypothetical protein
MTVSVSTCLNKIYPDIGADCAKCFGEDADCGATNCRVPCQDSLSSSCQNCLGPCTSALTVCTGTADIPQSTVTSTNDAASTMARSWVVMSAVFGVVMSHVLIV